MAWQEQLIPPLLWLAAAGVVPTGLRLVRATHRQVRLAAVAAILSSFVPVAAAVWFGATLYVALIGLGRLRSSGRGLEELSITLAMLYLPVGGFWWLAYRSGWQPLGFSGVMVALTGIHFHYAGFGAPLLSGLLGRRLRGNSELWGWYRASAVGVMVGPPLVGLGITFSRPLEALWAWLLGGSLALQGGLTWRSERHPWLRLSALSAVLAMALAAAYAWGRLRGWEVVSLEWMIPSHGLLNALGYVTCGLLGRSATRPSTR